MTEQDMAVGSSVDFSHEAVGFVFVAVAGPVPDDVAAVVPGYDFTLVFVAFVVFYI